MEDMASIFIYKEREEELRQKLIEATQELKTMKTVETKLFNLLNKAYQERDEARSQLQKLTPSHEMFLSHEINQESLLMFSSAKSLTESSSLSHGSPRPVDSFFNNVSSPEFSNNNNNNLSNNNCLNHHHQHLPMTDPGTAVIDCIARKRALPQKGKLLQAVIDAGPLLQTMFLAGPLPTWKNPPPLQQNLKLPQPLTIKQYNNSIEPYAFADVAASTCSPSMLNFASHSTTTTSWQFNNSSSSVKLQVPPRKRQRNQ